MIDHHCFVFGSNLAGIHGAGAAFHAKKHYGAVMGRGIGFYGNSYAIPTKDENIDTLPLERIKTYVDWFVEFATLHQELTFKVTAIGTGLAGYKHTDIAPMFAAAPENCILPEAWRSILPETSFERKWWVS